MNISKKEIASVLGLLGLSGAGQSGAAEGGFILPDFITDLANTVPLPVLVVICAVVYFLKPDKSSREIVCSKCNMTIGVEQSKDSAN